MGSGIAAAAIIAGDRVKLVDVDPDRTAAGVERARTRAARAHSSLTGEVSATSWDADHANVDLVLEAVAENREAKVAVLRQALSVVGEDAVVATNTSSLSVGDLARDSGDAARVLGLHFFSPAHSSRLVEAVTQPDLREGLLNAAVRWAEGLGKTVVTVRDAPGFLVNRVARPLYLVAERFVEAGAAAANVDAQLRATGLPIGPLEIVDRTGLDVHATVSEQMYTQLGAPHFRPVPIVRQLVGEGRLGLKSGGGFLDYLGGQRSPASEGDAGSASGGIPPIARLVLAAFVNEAALVVDDGYANPQTVDLALRLALRHEIGPFGWIERIGGRDTIVGILEQLSRQHNIPVPIARSLTSGVIDHDNH
jgi:3-hydroxybutyryl-CoA dehydrogenase